jgi:toxin ParE1/3/4
MHRVIFQERAKRWLYEIFWYINPDNSLAAVNVIQKIFDTIENLKIFPYLWKEMNILWIREIVEPKYKFRIIYLLREEEIQILAILNTKIINFLEKIFYVSARKSFT